MCVNFFSHTTFNGGWTVVWGLDRIVHVILLTFVYCKALLVWMSKLNFAKALICVNNIYQLK